MALTASVMVCPYPMRFVYEKQPMVFLQHNHFHSSLLWPRLPLISVESMIVSQHAYETKIKHIGQQVFRISSNISSIQRLVGYLGSAKDSQDVRTKLYVSIAPVVCTWTITFSNYWQCLCGMLCDTQHHAEMCADQVGRHLHTPVGKTLQSRVVTLFARQAKMSRISPSLMQPG